MSLEHPVKNKLLHTCNDEVDKLINDQLRMRPPKYLKILALSNHKCGASSKDLIRYTVIRLASLACNLLNNTLELFTKFN